MGSDQRGDVPPRVLLVDDHPMWRQTLRKVIERRTVGTVVAEAADGHEAVRLVDEHEPDVVVMDLELDELDGIEATRRVTAAHPDVRVLVLSASTRRAHVVDAVQAGASGYLVKTAGPDDVVEAIQRIHLGEIVFPPDLANVVLEEFRRLRANQPAPGRPASRAMDRAPAAEESVFALEGTVWTLSYDGKVVRMNDLKGLHDIAGLLALPGREVHVTDLVAAREGGMPSDAAAGSVSAAGGDAGIRVTGPGDAGAILDARAKSAYRNRLDELREELEEAEAFSDTERATRAREEMQFIAKELSAAVGLGGRDRKAADSSERARYSVTRAIRRAIERIGDVHPDLARHLDRSITTGAFCSYDPEQPVDWRLA